MFESVFLVQNHILNLCSSDMDTQRFFYSQKAGVKFCIKVFWYTKPIAQWFKFLICVQQVFFSCITKTIVIESDISK